MESQSIQILVYAYLRNIYSSRRIEEFCRNDYVAVMNGVDVIAFTAGVGENNGHVRKDVCSHLKYLGIEIDDEANSKRGEEVMISTKESKVKVYVIPTNEELAIARETVEVLA